VSAEYLPKFERIVIKIGSSLLIDDKGGINRGWLQSLIQDLIVLKQNNRVQLMLVCSGAIAIGCQLLQRNRNRLKLEEAQAVAAIGQIHLMQQFVQLLHPHQLQPAQVLMTIDDTEQRNRAMHIQRTIRQIWKLDAIPIINENDTIATDEIKYGDNDRLSARVAQMMMADCLMMLSNVDGLMQSFGDNNSNQKLIPTVRTIDQSIRQLAGKASNFGSGGMVTKLEAAQICMQSGCNMLLCNGNYSNPIAHYLTHQKGTWFYSPTKPKEVRKSWILNAVHLKGEIVIDSGAEQALYNNKSLLPVGVLEVKGQFKQADFVVIYNQTKQIVAKGIVAFSSREVAKIKGLHSSQVETLLMYQTKGIVVHKDDLVLCQTT